MSQKMIQEVLRAEAEAEAIRADALDKARARRERTEREAAANAEATVTALRRELRDREADVARRANELIEQSRQEADTDIEALRAAADEKMREAIKHIEWKLFDV
ncbi:MAG: hypothetical protein IIX90_00755 [Clostridia bacterium]|nr:hypothetical protein [Clostridia bacterium]